MIRDDAACYAINPTVMPLILYEANNYLLCYNQYNGNVYDMNSFHQIDINAFNRNYNNKTQNHVAHYLSSVELSLTNSLTLVRKATPTFRKRYKVNTS